MSSVEVGAWVWVIDDAERYLPGKAISGFVRGEDTIVRTEDGEDRKLSGSETATIEDCNPEALDSSISDLCQISDLNEMSILHNLRIRYKEDKIYTNVSSILISVNPFRMLPLYTPEVLDKYRATDPKDLDPHVFASAYNAYNNMIIDSKDQSVVISGESGAGKSEATKLILQFLTDASGSANGHVEGGKKVSSGLERQILAANPILEAFGNAKTLRNNNSSRFGKLITVNFDGGGTIVGGGIINYLLEKSRVVRQTVGERNYHVFYQLLTLVDTDPKLAEDLNLKDAELFSITGLSKAVHIDGISDEKDFEEFKNSMNILNFSEQEQLSIFKIVAGVLHFGNLEFIVKANANAEDGSAIKDMDVLNFAASMWGINAEDIDRFLTHKNIGSREKILVSFNVVQAQDARDAMLKNVYSTLFQFVVDKINSVLAAGGGTTRRKNFIGVLDIFGFESFEVNSFEQLCINYCNEKLQFHFNEHIFSMEQALYAAEGIVISGSSFVDNQPTLDLLEAKGTGIFGMCDEEINVPRGTDESMLSKMIRRHSTDKATIHPNFIKPGPRDCKHANNCFGILHYAGPVYYNVANFLEKNKDVLGDDITDCLRGSKLPLINVLFPKPIDDSGGRGRGGKSAKATLGSQFKSQLVSLINTLNSTDPHFVRCMKPNDLKIGNNFHAGRMQDQLRYAGLVEVCRIRKLGYPIRRDFNEFFKRYKCIAPGTSSLDDLIAFLSSAKGGNVLVDGEFAKGHTRVFMRTSQSHALELVRETAIVKVLTKVQSNMRRFICVCRYKAHKKLLVDLTSASAKKDEKELTKLLELSVELPHSGKHIANVVTARAILNRLRLEGRLTKQLEDAIASKEINALRIAVQAATPPSCNPQLDSPLISVATAAIDQVDEQLELLMKLKKAVQAKALPDLKALLAQASNMKHGPPYESPETKQAELLVVRIEQEDSALANLEAALAAANKDNEDAMQALSDAISKCCSYGLDDRITSAKKQYEGLEQQRGAEIAARKAAQLAEEQRKRAELMKSLNSALSDALKADTYVALNNAIEAAMSAGINSDTMDKAQARAAELNNADAMISKMNAATSALTAKLSSTDAASEINDGDISRLDLAITEAESAGLPEEKIGQALEANKTAAARFKKILDVQNNLREGIKTGDLIQMRAAVNDADNLDMRTDLVTQAKSKLKEAELKNRSENANAGTGPVADYEHAESARQLRHEIARQVRFSTKNFPGLRSPDDFARGMIFTKASVRDSFLIFSNEVIPKSITDLPKDLNKRAIQIFKDLLGYMGDKKMNFPEMLAHDILTKGFHYPTLRDEIYVQVIKQITKNERTESIAKGWQMMCLCAGTFPPSVDFENFLLHFIISRYETSRGAVRDYARYCLRTVDGMLAAGEASGFVPSVDEIKAYKERPPILATIELVDGNVITEALPVTPDLNVGKVLEICSGWLDLSDSRASSLGIFVYDLGTSSAPADASYTPPAYEELPRTPRPLRNSEFMGDVIVQKSRQKRKFKFVLKKKIYIPTHNYRGKDPHYDRLIYLQAEDEIIIQGNVPVSDAETALKFATLSVSIALGDNFPSTPAGLLEPGDGGNELILDYVPPDWREEMKPAKWAKDVFDLANSEYAEKEIDEMQLDFIDLASESPVYGTHWFYVLKVNAKAAQVLSLPTQMVIGFNSDGLHIFSVDMEFIQTYTYGEIYRWGGSAKEFCIILFDSKTSESFDLVVATAQASDMASIIIDHIEFLLVEKNTAEAAAGGSTST